MKIAQLQIKFENQNLIFKQAERVSGAFVHNCEKLWTPFTKLWKIVNAVHNIVKNCERRSQLHLEKF